MRNADYWRGRFSILEDSAHREAQRTIQDMEELYLDAQRSVQKEIESWYARFAVNNQISLTDARKWLTAGQLEEFHWSVEQYIKIGEQAGLDAAWLKKLENASARFHISRLEAVQTGIQQQLELLYGNQVDNKIKLAYNDEKTGKRELFIAQDGAKMNQWGVLQYFEEVQTKTGASAKADALLKLYDQKTRKLTIQNAFGDVRVRAGSAVVVALNLGDIVTNNYMVVNKVTHTFRGDEHMMELDLIGGEFIA